MMAGPLVSRLFFLLKVFVLFGAGLALFIRAVTTEAMPWWPDTAIVAAYMGSFALLIAVSRGLDRRGWRHLRNAGRATRIWWRVRNTV
jgi:hypothetical protein